MLAWDVSIVVLSEADSRSSLTAANISEAESVPDDLGRPS